MKQNVIFSVVMHEEAASTNKNDVENFVGELKKICTGEGFTPHQVFNYDETSLFGKKMSERTYITK